MPDPYQAPETAEERFNAWARALCVHPDPEVEAEQRLAGSEPWPAGIEGDGVPF